MHTKQVQVTALVAPVIAYLSSLVPVVGVSIATLALAQVGTAVPLVVSRCPPLTLSFAVGPLALIIVLATCEGTRGDISIVPHFSYFFWVLAYKLSAYALK